LSLGQSIVAVEMQLVDAVIVTVAAALFCALVAVIVAVPAATPVTSPLPFTVAAGGLPLAQVMLRPVSGIPAESRGVAVNCTVPPTRMLAVAGLTVTDATGTRLTATVAVPLFPSLVAVIVAVPTAAPVTSPLPFTVAATGLLLAHVMLRPVSGLPAESFGVAVSCTVPPTRTLAVAGLTDTDATGTLVTTTGAVSASEPPFCFAITWRAPGTAGAV